MWQLWFAIFLMAGWVNSSKNSWLVSSRYSRAATTANVDYDDFSSPIQDLLSTSTKAWTPPVPIIKSLNVESHIVHRYARTTVLSKIANPANVSQEVVFSIIIPDTAFISGFAMTVDGQTYTAYVKEKEEAKREYSEAVSHGQTAAHVQHQQSARDSNRFSVNVNVLPEQKVAFNLTYEELLQRRHHLYQHTVNLNPGQIVDDLTVDVFIYEPRNITELITNDIHSANEINPNGNSTNPKAEVEWIDGSNVKIHYRADEAEQKRIQALIKEATHGIAGQLTVGYDVQHDPTAGEVLVNSEGYFVYFFAPTDLPSLNKHVLFVLDVSGSMAGRKIEQLRETMLAILDDLQPTDFFNIIEFSYSVTVRNLDIAAESTVYNPLRDYEGLEKEMVARIDNTPPFPATPHYIEKAKAIVRKMTAGGGTNIYDALKKAVEIAKRGVAFNTSLTSSNQTEVPTKPQPLIIFLTDGEPTVGETRLSHIERDIDKFNSENESVSGKAPIFSLAFGEGADFKFLKRISLLNDGFARQIYEAADAELQLKDLYQQISSPVLANVKFVYPMDQVDEGSLTKRIFSNYFSGSEIVVTGKLKNCNNNSNNDFGMEAHTRDGLKQFQTNTLSANENTKLGALERLWAYMTIKYLLDEQEVFEANLQKSHNEMPPDPKKELINGTVPEEKKQTPKEQALKIALKYSFVCPLTSLVVVKPNGTTSDKNPESASPASESFSAQQNFFAITSAAAARPSLLIGQPFFNKKGIQSMIYPSTTPNFFAMEEKLDGGIVGESLDLTTFAPTTQLPDSNEPEWLKSAISSDDTIILPNVNGSSLNLTLAKIDVKNDEFGSCQAKNVSGVCRHLRHCIRDDLMNLENYSQHFLCILPGNFAGVCCHQQKVLETTTVTESTTILTTIVSS